MKNKPAKDPRDKFYTAPHAAKFCFNAARRIVGELGVAHPRWIEPGAGRGDFYKLLPQGSVGLDIAPECGGVLRRDFLSYRSRIPRERAVIVGNPPFGARGATALAFVNYAANIADTIAFILPVLFRKYSAQRRISGDLRLIADIALDAENAFYTDAGAFFCRTCFQIWTRRDSGRENLRLLSPPPIAHPDFAIRQYNNTKAAEKHFAEEFDFAVPRQGFEDYSRREISADNCERNKQWALFRARTKRVFKRLWNFDFAALARRNTVIPGFGKADVVGAYREMYGG
jgi:hypothetical protein